MTKSVVRGYTLSPPFPGAAPFDRLQGSAALKRFLEQLPPDPGREIFMALSRASVFIREMALPAMPLEDAVASVENSLVIHCHLPPGEIYYDLLILNAGDDGFSALLVYAARKEMDALLSLFDETGHGNGVRGVIPSSYGIAVLSKVADPSWKGQHRLFRWEQGGLEELCVVKDGMLMASIAAPKDGEDEKKMILSALTERFPEVTLPPLDAALLFKDNPPAHSGVKRFPPLSLNRASTALAPTVMGARIISLDETPVKVKVFHPLTYILPFIFLLVGALYYVTNEKRNDLVDSTASLDAVKKEVATLTSKLEPMQETVDRLAKASVFKQDVEAFMVNRPEIYTAIDEIATLVPEGTWFSSLTFSNGQMTLRGRGEDALKVIELLRTSSRFDEVKLKGSVNRRKTGDEHFTVTLGLRLADPSDVPNLLDDEREAE